MIVSSPLGFNVGDLYIDLFEITGRRLMLKCEGFNFAGSIKIKAAVEMVDEGEREGRFAPGDTLIESSSGNMGVALSIVAARRGYRFICVTDARCNRTAQRVMETLGSEVHIITEPDPANGFLGARLAYVKRLCEGNPAYRWLNQYANAGNWMGHYRTTAQEIAKAFPDLDVLFIGAGTTGTLMGCARYFRETRPSVTIVAVDSAGSVTFGQSDATRLIPGLGTSVRPDILDPTCVDAVVHVTEAETIRTCHELVHHGFLLGGSTGTVVCGAMDWLSAVGAPDDLTTVAISPDLGHPYLDTIYDETWLSTCFR
jgi:N-(2-amino-2-carboxyethyl)-L-glutamate synthase